MQFFVGNGACQHVAVGRVPAAFPGVLSYIGVPVVCSQFPERFIAGSHSLPLRPDAIPQAASHPLIHPLQMRTDIGKLKVVHPSLTDLAEPLQSLVHGDRAGFPGHLPEFCFEPGETGQYTFTSPAAAT